MPKSLADGHIKVAILTTAPANPAAPLVSELNAGINGAARILADDFLWTATSSDKFAEKALDDVNNVNALGSSNFQTAMTIFRFFNSSTGVADPTEDSLFTAVKVKGATLYIYARKTGKLSTAVWAASDEIYLGGSVLVDLPQEPQNAGGYLKKRVELEPQQMYPNIAAA